MSVAEWTKATLIYRRTGNLRAIQFLLGHTMLESAGRYPDIEVEDALALAEQTEMGRATGECLQQRRHAPAHPGG